MSKPSNRKNKNAAALAETEDRMALFAFDQRMERQAEQDQQRRQQFLAEARQQIAQDRLEAEVAGLDIYRQQAIAAAVSDKTLAPQVAAMIPVGLASREEIDATVQLGVDKTAEIAAEISGQQQGEPTVQARDEQTGRFLPQQPAAGDQYLPAGMTADELAKAQSGSLSMQDYAAMRDRLGFVNRDSGLFG
jgi:hypothetical protein